MDADTQEIIRKVRPPESAMMPATYNPTRRAAMTPRDRLPGSCVTRGNRTPTGLVERCPLLGGKPARIISQQTVQQPLGAILSDLRASCDR